MNDRLFRLWLIPALGILIPNITGLFGNLGPGNLTYWYGYFHFILLSFLLWHGNRFFLFRQRMFYDWFNTPVKKLATLLFANIFYTTPITILLLVIWYELAGFDSVDWNAVYVTTLLNVIAVIFITHVYETIFLIRERETDALQFATLEKAKVESELAALKNQIDPHFMFNSLNALIYLIEEKKEEALKFAEDLSEVYRYILSNRNKNLVSLTDEIEFLKNYFSLMKIRFDNSIRLNISIRGLENFLIPPISLQLLAENAVKHNYFSEEQPLIMDLCMTESELVFQNEKRLKEIGNSSRLGLKNLSQRFLITADKKVEIFSDDNYFSVRLPLIKIKE